MSEGLECKGDWMLGSACGRCSRCQRTAGATIEALKDIKAKLEKRFLQITMYIPPQPPKQLGIDHTDEFKLKCYEAARKAAYEDL